MAKATADIRSLARAQTALAIRTLHVNCVEKSADEERPSMQIDGAGLPY